MAWTLTEEQELVRDSIREWVAREVEPVAAKVDETGEFPMELFKRAGELGFLGVSFSKKYGGSGMPYIMEQVLSEEVGKSLPALSMSFSVHCAVARNVLYFGNEEQKQKYLPKAVSGEWIFATTAVDPSGGTNFTEAQNIGRFDGDDVIVTCEMPYATNGAVADVINFPGAVNGTPVSLMIDVFAAGDAIKPGPYVTAGMKGMGLASVSYNEVRVPASDILAMGPMPADQAVAWLNYGANFMGAMERVFDMTKAYVMKRSRMGKPLGTYQSVAHKLVECHIIIENIRAIIEAASKTFEQRPADVPLCFAAKAYATEQSAIVAKSLIDLWGGVGVMEETGVMRFMRDIITMPPGELATFALYDAIAQTALDIPVETQLDIYRWPDVELD